MPLGHVNPGTNAGARRDRLPEVCQESSGFKLNAWETEEEGLGEVSGGEVQRETGGSP